MLKRAVYVLHHRWHFPDSAPPVGRIGRRRGRTEAGRSADADGSNVPAQVRDAPHPAGKPGKATERKVSLPAVARRGATPAPERPQGRSGAFAWVGWVGASGGRSAEPPRSVDSSPLMPDLTHRLYIDESGDNTHSLLDDERRFLGITGVLFRRDVYDPAVPYGLEQLKRRHLTYDVDDPPILVRNAIIRQRGPFGLFRVPSRRAAWAADLLEFLRTLQCEVFTVVTDKQAYYRRFGDAAFDPYSYSLQVLLSRARRLLAQAPGAADVMVESRGKIEDQQLQESYRFFWEHGDDYVTPRQVQSALPNNALIIRRKDSNVAGLQVADVLAYGLKKDVLERLHHQPLSEMSSFTREVNSAIALRIGSYGRCLLS